LDDDVAGVEQELVLPGEALSRLRVATEIFLVFDLQIPDGDPTDLTVEVNGKSIPGSQLVPTMPRFGESTTAGGRNRRVYPQWWALRLEHELLPGSAPATLTVRVKTRGRTDIVLNGDRFRDQNKVYEGPSFGDWPHLAAIKLEYDGDYRLPVRLPLQSADTKSYVIDSSGERRPTRSVHRIRIVTLQSNEAELRWETPPVTSAEELALGFFAYSGRNGSGELFVGDEYALTFPLGSGEDFEIEQAPYRLCHRAEPPNGDTAYGGYILLMPPEERDGPVPLSVRFRSGMSIEALFFSLNVDENPEKLRELAEHCEVPDTGSLLNGAFRVVDASRNRYPEDTGRWSVRDVF
jgi:hypothetical protein